MILFQWISTMFLRLKIVGGMLLGLIALAGCNQAANNPVASSPEVIPQYSPVSERTSNMVKVRLIDLNGKLTGPVMVPKVVHTDEVWQELLTPEQFQITRDRGTEPAFCGGLLNNKGEGVYVCVDCGLPLFKSQAKFESGTGWPSFFQPIAPENVLEIPDRSYGMDRTEIVCARCGAHLGHVFDDGPAPTGLRFCLNSAALKFVPESELKSVGEKIP